MFDKVPSEGGGVHASVATVATPLCVVVANTSKRARRWGGGGGGAYCKCLKFCPFFHSFPYLHYF